MRFKDNRMIVLSVIVAFLAGLATLYILQQSEFNKIEAQIDALAAQVEQLDKPNYDLNKDGLVDIEDVQWLAKYVAELG